MVFHAFLDVQVDAVRVPLLFEQAEVFDLVLFADFLEYGLVFRRDLGPLFAVHRHVGYADRTDDRPVEVLGDFVPPLSVAGGAAGDAGVKDAAFQRGVHLRESDELTFRAQPGKQVAQDGAVLANLLALVRAQVRQRLPAENVLIGVVVAEDRLAARRVAEDANHVVFNRVREREVGVVAGRKAPQVAHVDNGQVSAHVSRIDFRELQRVVVH